MTKQLDAQSMESIEPKQIYSDANLVLVFQVKRLEKYLTDENRNDLKDLHAWLKNLTLLPTDKCKELVVQFGAEDYPDSFRGNEVVGIVFRGDDDIEQSVIDNLAENYSFDVEQNDGRQILVGRPSLCFSGNSMLIAERERLDSFIKTVPDAGNDGRYLDILSSVSPDLDIAARIDFRNKSFRDFLVGIFQALPGYRDLDNDCLSIIANKVQMVELDVDLKAARPFFLKFECRRSDDVETAKIAAKQFIDATKNFVNELEGRFTVGPFAEDFGGAGSKFTGEVTKLLSEAQISSDDSTVTIETRNTETGRKTLNRFIELMVAIGDAIGGVLD